MAFQSDAFQAGIFQTEGSTEVPGSLTAGAVILAARQTSATAYAVVLRTSPNSITADAVVWRSIQSSGSVDAFVQPYFRVGAWIASLTGRTGSLSADAIIWSSRSASLVGAAVLKATFQPTFTAASDLLRTQTFSIGMGAVVSRTMQASFSAEAWVYSTAGRSISIDAVLQSSRGATLTANSITQKTFGPLTFSANAHMDKFGITKTRTIDAYLAGGLRTQHDRGTPPHYDNDPDTAIVLAQSIGVYQQGMDLHSVLVALVARVGELEAN